LIQTSLLLKWRGDFYLRENFSFLQGDFSIACLCAAFCHPKKLFYPCLGFAQARGFAKQVTGSSNSFPLTRDPAVARIKKSVRHVSPMSG